MGRYEKTEIYELYKENIKKPVEEMEPWEKELKKMHDAEVKRNKRRRKAGFEEKLFDPIVMQNIDWGK